MVIRSTDCVTPKFKKGAKVVENKREGTVRSSDFTGDPRGPVIQVRWKDRTTSMHCAQELSVREDGLSLPMAEDELIKENELLSKAAFHFVATYVKTVERDGFQNFPTNDAVYLALPGGRAMRGRVTQGVNVEANRTKGAQVWSDKTACGRREMRRWRHMVVRWDLDLTSGFEQPLKAVEAMDLMRETLRITPELQGADEALDIVQEPGPDSDERKLVTRISWPEFQPAHIL